VNADTVSASPIMIATVLFIRSIDFILFFRQPGDARSTVSALAAK
jgi:hypothetical protein